MMKLIKSKFIQLMFLLGFVPKTKLIEKTTELKTIRDLFETPNTKNRRPREENEKWSNYWTNELEPHYLSYYMRKISIHPEIMVSLIKTIIEYDWDDIANFMKETSWYWGDNREVTPNKYELVMCVILLLEACINRGGDTGKYDGNDAYKWSSGGFSVSIVNKEIVVEFDKTLHHD